MLNQPKSENINILLVLHTGSEFAGFTKHVKLLNCCDKIGIKEVLKYTELNLYFSITAEYDSFPIETCENCSEVWSKIF